MLEPCINHRSTDGGFTREIVAELRRMGENYEQTTLKLDNIQRHLNQNYEQTTRKLENIQQDCRQLNQSYQRFNENYQQLNQKTDRLEGQMTRVEQLCAIVCHSPCQSHCTL